MPAIVQSPSSTGWPFPVTEHVVLHDQTINRGRFSWGILTTPGVDILNRPHNSSQSSYNIGIVQIVSWTMSIDSIVSFETEVQLVYFTQF